MEMEDFKKLQQEAQEAHTKALKLKEKVEAAQFEMAQARMAPLKAIVKRAHECFCAYNHTDGCSWGYEGDSWSGGAHQIWLMHYDKMVRGTQYSPAVITLDELTKLLDVIEPLKKEVKTAMFMIRQGKFNP